MSQVRFKSLIDSLGLSVCLRMERGRHRQLRIKKLRGIQALLAKSEREYGASRQAVAVGDTEGRVG